MNGKKGSCVMIDINLMSKAVPPEAVRKSGGGGLAPSRKWIRDVWEFAREDTNRVTFSLKVGLAVLLASLLILFRGPFEVFGNNIIWSIITVSMIFEYTVGAMFNRGFNRALGSLLAGIFAIVVMHVGLSSGHIAEPYVIALSIFFIGAATSFMKLWPSLVPYEYGFRVVLFTYCLIIISDYRMGSPVRTAMERLYLIAIGGMIAVLVNVLIFPIWAGDQLHRELVSCFSSVADSLEECVEKYLRDEGLDRPEFSKKVMDEFPDEPAFRKCKATLNTSSKLESLANAAKWEPPHGRFMHFFYPWSEYVKVGAVLRHCAYEVMALHGCLHSEIQAPYNLRCTFQHEILDATNQAAELIRSLAKDISSMKHTLHSSPLRRVHSSTERLQRSIDTHSYLLTPIHESSSDDCLPPPKLPNKLSSTLSLNLKDFSDKLNEQYCSNNNNDDEPKPVLPAVAPVRSESYHENMKKQQRRLHSWPSREVDDFGEDGGAEAGLIPRMKALESTAALSLATFTSLLIEFVARLDHLVDAVDVLAEMAKFKAEK
ncbi:aluminum-activated malate transporter 9-like [Iris pallida]|uniref:Aluminum-activated malate transporter 9-like n=1 Tax=Iris pallida TaxID=29817 RepID=A0AAX6GLC9_IRIPA|nr:aluminum-activated malate transporter 9-like [Iris pallida]